MILTPLSKTLGGKVNHSSAGAVLAFRKIKVDPMPESGLHYRGHHAGLLTGFPAKKQLALPLERISKKNDLKELDLTDLQQIEQYMTRNLFIEAQPQKRPPLRLKRMEKGKEHLHLWVRMLFSCLVDADFLDTESLWLLKNYLRGMHSSCQDLKIRFDSFVEKLQEKASLHL
jgi:CRISPR-associated endonuclease/helicase Cas3